MSKVDIRAAGAVVLVGCALTSAASERPSVSRECAVLDGQISCISAATLTGHPPSTYEVVVVGARSISSCEGPPYPSMCVLDVNGRVTCWDGPAPDGLVCASTPHDAAPTVLRLAEPVSEFVGCRRHGCGLRTDGRVECVERPELDVDASTWTCDETQYVVYVPALVDLVSANCGRTEEGRFFCWGAWTAIDQFFGGTSASDVHRTYAPSPREFSELHDAHGVVVSGRLWDTSSRDGWLGCVATTDHITCRDVHGSAFDVAASVGALCPLADFMLALDDAGTVRIFSSESGPAPWPGAVLEELGSSIVAIGGPAFAAEEPGPCGVLGAGGVLSAVWSRGPTLADVVIRTARVD